jgi:hypothetical protein
MYFFQMISGSINMMKVLFKKLQNGFRMLTKVEVDMIVDGSNLQSFKKGAVLLRADKLLLNVTWPLNGLCGSTI